MNVKDLVITSLETITVFDLSGNYWFTLDELQNASIANAEETTDITGRAGRKISTLKRNKSFTVTGTNGVISGGLLEAQTGGKFETPESGVTVLWTDYCTAAVANGASVSTITLTQTPAGSDHPTVFVLQSDGTVGDEIEYATTAGSGKYSISGSTITFGKTSDNFDVPAGAEVVVYYKTVITSNISFLESDSKVFSEKGNVYLDAMAEDKCGNVLHVQIHCPKVEFSGNFTLEFGDNQAVHNFEMSSLAGACDANGNLWTYAVYGVSDDED